MITAVATTTGYLFWIAILAIIIMDVVFLYNDDCEIQATVFTGAALIGLYLFTDAFTGIRWPILAIGTFGYFLIGVIWAFFKWYRYIIKSLKDFKTIWDQHPDPNSTFEIYKKNRKPTAANNKSRITGWISLWPFSMGWWGLTFPRRAAVWLYDRLSTVFDRIATKIWESQ